MLFNSIAFLIFLPIVFLLYWFVFRNRRWQNMLLLVASYVFYGWWDWRFLLLIAFTSLCSYVSGILIERFEGYRVRQRAVSNDLEVTELGDDATLGILPFHKSWEYCLHTSRILTKFAYKLCIR